MPSERISIPRLLMLLPAVAWASIAGCGQKGPLFLPDDPSVMQSTIPDPQSDEGDVDVDDDEAGAADRQPEDDPS